METINQIQMFAVLALPVLFAITLHEVAHGWVARRLGDRTAEMLGRLTINPLRHIDLVGTVLVPMASWFLAGFLFGWAKPVPVDVRNLHNPRRDMALVALAGPLANLIMALFWGLVFNLGSLLANSFGSVALFLQLSGIAGILINVFLMVLNLVPLLPLDGGRVLHALLPATWAHRFARLEPYGLIILVALLVFGVLGSVLLPVVKAVMGILPGGAAAIAVFF